MNGAEALRRLHRLRQEWRHAGEGAEVSWTVRGIEMALKALRDIAKEERIRNMERRPRINRWRAADMYRALRVGLDQLKRGDRARAIETFEKGIQAAKGQG